MGASSTENNTVDFWSIVLAFAENLMALWDARAALQNSKALSLSPDLPKRVKASDTHMKGIPTSGSIRTRPSSHERRGNSVRTILSLSRRGIISSRTGGQDRATLMQPRVARTRSSSVFFPSVEYPQGRPVDF